MPIQSYHQRNVRHHDRYHPIVAIFGWRRMKMTVFGSQQHLRRSMLHHDSPQCRHFSWSVVPCYSIDVVYCVMSCISPLVYSDCVERVVNSTARQFPIIVVANNIVVWVGDKIPTDHNPIHIPHTLRPYCLVSHPNINHIIPVSGPGHILPVFVVVHMWHIRALLFPMMTTLMS